MAKGKPQRRGGTFVLDCSVTVAWFFEDEASAYAEAVEDALGSALAEVPALWTLEVANALLVGERRKRTTEAKVTQFLGLLRALPITIDDETAIRAQHETLQLARAHNLSMYDGAYLELALRRGLPLATLDTRLKTVAGGVGVSAYRP
jgi:predicted nucleic acid-binding protein